jgi:beta-lactamase regulating signal transducer with metallopeptidase domain
MRELLALFEQVSSTFWPGVVNHLWQTTILAAMIYGLMLLVRNSPARVRYRLWLVAAAKFAIPATVFALIFSRLGIFYRTEGAPAGSQLITKLAEPFGVKATNVMISAVADDSYQGQLFSALTVIWLIGCGAFLINWLRRRSEIQRAMLRSREVRVGREFEMVERVRAQLGLSRSVTVMLSPDNIEPGVWQTVRPVILLPESVVRELDDEELQAVIIHELAHVERCDNILANSHRILACIFWFHPIVWLINRKLISEREQACDERVVEIGGSPSAYAASILKIVRSCSGRKLAGFTGATAGSNLQKRIEDILRQRRQRSVSIWHRALEYSLAAAVLAGSAWIGYTSHAQVAVCRQTEISNQSATEKVAPASLPSKNQARDNQRDSNGGDP